MKDEIVLMGIMFSDYSIRELGTGKVSLIGTFHQYQSAVFPFTVAPFFVTPLLTNIRGKLTKPLTVAVRIEDQNSGLILSNTVSEVGIHPDFVFSGAEVLDAAFPAGPITFQSAGIYTVTVMVDGEKVGTRSLSVISISAMPQPPKPSQ